MNAIILLKNDEKEAVVEVLKEEIRQYREALAKPEDVEGESADYARKRRWDYTRKLETLVAALTKIESPEAVK